MKTTFDPNSNQPLDESTHWSAHTVAQWKEARLMKGIIDLYFCNE